MQKESVKNDYLTSIHNATESLKNGQYGSVLKNLYLAKENDNSEQWKDDFGSIVIPFWNGINPVGLELLGCIACCEPAFPIICPMICCDYCCGTDCFFGGIENCCECLCGC